MKSKITLVSSLLTAAILVMAMNASAHIVLVMTLNASTDQSSYTLGNDVEIDADWDIADTHFELYMFMHDSAIVYMNVTKVGGGGQFNNVGWWQNGDQRGGAVYVTCYQYEGDASYTWDSSAGSTGTWYVHVEVHAWHNVSTPHLYKFGEVDTATFTLNSP